MLVKFPTQATVIYCVSSHHKNTWNNHLTPFISFLGSGKLIYRLPFSVCFQELRLSKYPEPRKDNSFSGIGHVF